MLNKGNEHGLFLFCSLKMLFRFSLGAFVQMLAPYGRAGLMTALKYVFLLFNVEMLEISKIINRQEK